MIADALRCRIIPTDTCQRVAHLEPGPHTKFPERLLSGRRPPAAEIFAAGAEIMRAARNATSVEKLLQNRPRRTRWCGHRHRYAFAGGVAHATC
jgi:hypothetical protein